MNNQQLEPVTVEAYFERCRLMRTKADMAAKTMDAMLIAPLLAFAGPLLKAMGLDKAVSIYQSLQSLNDEHMRNFLFSVNAILKAAQDDQVSVDSFGESLVEHAEQIKYIFTASKEQPVYSDDTRGSAPAVLGQNGKRKKLSRKVHAEGSTL
jgi:hypothetical protein